MKEKASNRYRIALSFLCAIVLTVLAIFGIKTTTAYFTDNESNSNKFTIGYVDISVDEIYQQYSSAQAGENSFQKVIRLKNAGTSGKKDAAESYVRTRLQFSSEDIESVSYLSGDGGVTWYKASDYKNHLPEHWHYKAGGDLNGYYYYDKILQPGDETTPLITNVKTDFSGNNIYRADNEALAPNQNDSTNAADRPDITWNINSRAQDFDIDVYAEGIQAKDHSGNQYYRNYEEAWAQFLAQK